LTSPGFAEASFAEASFAEAWRAGGEVSSFFKIV